MPSGDGFIFDGFSNARLSSQLLIAEHPFEVREFSWLSDGISFAEQFIWWLYDMGFGKVNLNRF